MVSGHGSSSAKVFLVADAAQGDDLKTGFALSGYKESLLKVFCKNAGVDWNSTYRTCLIKEELQPYEQMKKKKDSEATVASYYLTIQVPQFAPILLKELATLKPDLVVPLGELSFQYLSGINEIRKFRGSVLPSNPLCGIEKFTKILPILGPYPYLYKDNRQKFISQVDFNKIPKWTNDRPIPDDTYRIWVARSADSLRAFLNRSYSVCFESGGFLVFDIETFMNIPTCISFCFDGFESVCVPFLDLSISQFDRAEMVGMVAKVLASPIRKVNQNIKYDLKTMERWGFAVSNVVGDTMLATSTLYCEFPKNLGFLTSIYTDLPYFKDEGRQYDPSKHKKDQFYLYNAKDSLATHQIYTKQISETIELGTAEVYEKLVQLLPIYRRMEDRGIRIDSAQRARLLAKYESLYYRHKLILERLINEEGFNPLSWPACARLVFEKMGYTKMRGVEGTDEESLNMLMCFGNPKEVTKEWGKQTLLALIECRKIHKVIEILELDVYPDGRFRCEFNLSGTETGRTSAGQTTDYFLKDDPKKPGKTKQINLGHSLQTIGKHGFKIGGSTYGEDVRSMFVPSFGFSFVEIDLAGAEARVDRVLSGNFDMGVFDNPGIHKLTGSWVFGVAPSEIKKGSHEYHLSKTVRHAGERNMGANRFFMMCQDEGVGLSLTLPEATRILDDFHKNQPEIRSVYHKEIEIALKTTNCLVAPNGRRRDFFDRIDHHTINEGISFLPQCIVSDTTKFSFIPTCLEAPWAHLLTEAHDGSLWEIPTGREEEFAIAYKRNIEQPIDFRKGSLKRDYQLIIPAECSKGLDWENLEEFRI